MPKTPVELLKSVTWERLEEWAGSRSVQRGERYQKGGRVQNLRLTPNGGILANVIGTKPYITLVTVSTKRRGVAIGSECSCPVGSDCKHGVATILAYTAAVKAKAPVPVTGKADADLGRLRNPENDEDEDEDFGSDEFDDDFGEDDDEDEQPPRRASRGKKSESDNDLAGFLKGKSKKELEALVLNLSKSKPDVRGELVDKARLAGGKVSQIAASLRREIANLTAEPSWRNRWSGEGDVADFDRVRKNMQSLLDQKHYDAVVQVAGDLVESGLSYVESCDDDGDAASQISECLDIGFEALSKVKWPAAKKLLWAIDASLKDQWDLCSGATDVLAKISDVSAWSEVADSLLTRLGKMPKGGADGEFSRQYERDSLTRCIIDALASAKRNDEILPLYAQEARVNGSWQRYVDRLIAAKRPDEARKAAEEGIKQIGDRWPGITKSLREAIAKIAEHDGDYEILVSLRRNEFLEHPSVSTFKELQKAANKAKSWDKIRKWAIAFLETGKLGTFKPEREKGQAKGYGRYQTYPAYDVLIHLAIDEKKPAEVLSWYDAATKKKELRGGYEISVAQAVEKSHPDRALVIWRRLAEQQIAITNPSAYETAVSYLKHVRDIMKKMGKEKEWAAYLANLREANKRKPRCIQELRRLSGERLF